MFSVRLINADSYQAQPLPQLDPTFSQFRGSEIKHVPIIRIFGTTSNGEKTCLHIHGVFPYLYVPYTGEEDPASLAYRLSASLDAAINVSLGCATSNTQHVYLIQRVSGIPFYGYHRKEHQYLKIYFYNPAMIKRAADLLQNGSVLNQSLQPHEAHIPYILQFMIDYNVYGMSLVNLSNVKHRRLTQTLAELTSSGQSTTSENSHIEYLPSTIERQSTCELEIDALASDIMNRREIESGLELNPGLAAIWEEERARRAQAGFQGGDSQLVNPKSPPRPIFRPTDNDIYQEHRLARRLSIISQCDESTLSTTSNRSVAYAAEVKKGENLLNSSNLLLSNPTAERTSEREDPTLCVNFLDSRTETASQQKTPDCSILGTEDAQLVDLLVQLAGENEENQDSIDLDSLLGSQVSAMRNGEKSDNEEEDVIDLNLTSLQLDYLNSLEIPAEQADEASKNDQNNLSPTDLEPFLLSHETSSCSRSADEGKTTKRCQVPQYDGAGDVSPTLLNSDDENNDTHPKEFSHLPEYNGSCDESASQSRKFNNLDDTLINKLPSNDFVTTKNNDKSSERCRSSSPVDAPFQSSIVPSIYIADEYMSEYHDSNYEPLDRLLAIGPDYVPDLEGLHSSMEIGILLSSADSDSPESVDEAPEDDAIPLETVLNGDPCFTESAELDKSDLTELQDQYVSLLGNSLLPDVHTNLRIESDNMGNSSNFSDSDYQTGEKTCEILLNVQSPRSSITSRGSSSSSENVAPNIPEPETRNCTKGKFNASYPLDKQSWNSKDSTRIATDNSDYNCNVVATWAELQNLQFVDKEKMEGRLGRSKERGQHSQGSRQMRRRANKRSVEKTPSQILGLDSDKVTTNTSTLSPLKDGNNYSLSLRKIFTNNETKSPIKITTNMSLSPIDPDITILDKNLTETIVNIVKEKCSTSPRVPDIAAEVEVEQQTSFDQTQTRSHLNSSHETTIGSENYAPHAELSASDTCNADEHDNVKEIVNSEESRENHLTELNEPLTTNRITEGYSYYSSERSQRDYKAGGFAHWHCQLLRRHKIVQDQVFTSDQVWVIEKRKRGRQPRRICGGACMRGDCRIPIVPLNKIVDKSHENSIIVEEKYSPIENKTAEFREIKIRGSTKKRIGPKSHLTTRKSRVVRNPIDSSSSDSNEDNITVANVEQPLAENSYIKKSLNEPISEPMPGNKEETGDRESAALAAAEAEAPSCVTDCAKRGDDLAHNSYGMRRKYSRKKKSRVRKIISIKSSKITRNGLVQRVTQLAKHENDNVADLPGIPGVGVYQSDVKRRRRPRKDAFTCCKQVSSENMSTEPSQKTRNKMQPVLFKNWASKQEISSQRPNGFVNCVENDLSGDKNNALSPDRRTINSPSFDFAPVSPIAKRNLRTHDNSKDDSFSINQASTPKKIVSEYHGLTETKLSECVALNLMMREVKSRSTRAKLKMLLEKRRNKTTNRCRDKEEKTITAERTSLSSQETETETPVDLKNSEFPPISITEDSTKNGEIDGSEEADNENLSFETVTDVCEIDQMILEPKDEIVDTEIAVSSTINAETSRLFEAELELLENRIPEANHIEELFNERKELSYQTDQFMTTIIESNLLSGNNYTVDAVSLEIPACLFEEDSNYSVDKRSPKKIGGDSDGNLKISNYSENVDDVYSDVSVDYRDLDVYDVESLTPSSSLAALNEATLDGTEMSLNFDETTESIIAENSKFSETQSVSSCFEKSGSELKSEGIIDSSFELASPEFEALSPSPKTCDLIEPSVEEFAVHTTVAILENARDFEYSLTYTTDNSCTETQQEKVSVSDSNTDLDQEIQELVSQVVMQIENQSNLPCETDTLVIEVLEPILDKNSKEIAGKIEIVSQGIEKPETQTITERINKMRIAAEEDGKSYRTNELINSASSETLVDEIKSFANETDSQINSQQTLIHKSELIETKLESKSDEELGISMTNDALPKRSSKCRPVSIKLVNIDLSRFQGFRPKNLKPRVAEAEFLIQQNCLLSSAGDINEENFETADVQEPTIDDEKNNKSREPRITWESSRLIGITDKVESFEATPMESKTPFEITGEDETIVNTIVVESTTLIENFKESEKIEKLMPKESTSPIIISEENEIFETVMPIETRTSSQNRTEKKNKRIVKRSRLPMRRSRRKCAEKTRLKLSQQTSLQLSSAESQPSSEECDIGMENHNLKSELRPHEKSENLLTHEVKISESEVKTVFQSLKYASTGVHCSYLEEEESSTAEIKAQENLTNKKSTENSQECLLSMQIIPNENKAPYVKCVKKFGSENSSLVNSRDTSPAINASTEENTSVDENVKPNSRPRAYARKRYRQSRGKRRPVPPQLKLALQKKALQQQANISSDSQTSVQHISFDKMEQDNACSLQHRLTSRNIANIEAKDSVSSGEKSEVEPDTLKNDKKWLRSHLPSRIINRNVIDLQSSQTPKRRHRSAKVAQFKPSIETILEEPIQNTGVKKSRKTKVVSETIVKENNDAMIFLNDDNSRNISDGSELLVSKMVGDEEPRISTNLQISDIDEKITEPRIQQSSPKKNTRYVINTNSEGFISTPENIAIESPDISVGRKRKRVCTKKISSSIAEELSSKIFSSQEETTQNKVGNVSETIVEFSLLSCKIGEKDDQSKNSDIAEVSQLHKSNEPLEKRAEDITENISRQVKLISQKIKQDEILESNVQQPSADVTISIEENDPSTKKSNSENGKLKCKLPHKTKNKNISATILASADSSNLNASNLPNGKNTENITEQISQEIESSLPNIAVKTAQQTCIKTNKRGRPRKVVVPKIEEPSTESVPELVIKDQSININNTDNSEKSELQEIGKINPKSKTPMLISILNSPPERNVEGLCSQIIDQHPTEPEIHVKVKKRGRPRKISALNSRKPRQPKTQDSDEKTYKILEQSKLSQKLEQDENKSTNLKAETPELGLLIPSQAEEDAQLNIEKMFNLSPNKINEETKTSASPSHQPISTDEKYEQDFGSSIIPISQNIDKKAFTESDFNSSSKEDAAQSETRQNLKNFVPHNQNVSSESESTPVETTQIFRNQVVEQNSSVTNDDPENVEPIMLVEPTGRNRLRTRRPDNTLLSQSQYLMEDRDNIEDLQKPETLSQADQDKTSQPEIMTKRRGRSKKSQKLNNHQLDRENTSESTNYALFETSEKTHSTARRRGRYGKTTDTNFPKLDSVEDNCEAVTKDKCLTETKLPSKITQQDKTLTASVLPTEKCRSAKILEKDDNQDHDIADETSQESQSLQTRIMQALIESDSKNVNKKGRHRKISTTIIEDMSQKSISSSEEMSLKSSAEKLNEAETELQTSVTTKKKSCIAKKSEVDEKEVEQKQLSQIIGSKIIDDAAKSNSPSRSMKRTRTEKTPEPKPDNFVLFEEATQKISVETTSEPNSSLHKVVNLEPVRAQKRVRFDQDSIQYCTQQLRPSESFVNNEMVEVSPNKHKKYLLSLNRDASPTKVERSENHEKSMKICRTTRATVANLSRQIFTVKDQQQQEHTNNPAGSEGNNGVAAKSECTISSSDNASLDLPSLQEGSTSQERPENFHGFLQRVAKSRTQEQAIQSDRMEQSKEMQPNDLDLGLMNKISLFTNSKMSLAEPTRCRSTKPFVQNQELNIILQRLSRDTLKNYGFEYNAKNKTFVKNLKKHRPDSDYQFPAYDGPADFSSTESSDDDNPADVTVAREEKRVCVYQSGKKATNTKIQSVVTPRKRKLDEATDAQSPTSKSITTPCSKTPFDSPNGTSMLKSPGRVSGYYPPLQIIVTSPKVRKQTSEARDAQVQLENCDIPVSSSACITPRRKNEQRLYDNLLRGKMSAMKSPKNVIGDKRATPVTMGSQRPGELDEIKSGKQREKIAINISTMTNKCDVAAGNHNFSSTLRDGKDVRKKLVFSTAGHETPTDQISNEGLDYQSTNLRTSSQTIGGHRFSVNDAQKSLVHLENLANEKTTTLDCQPGSSHSDSITIDENLALYQVTTDEDSEDDDACNVTFTQYIDSEIEKNKNLTLDRSKISQETKEIISLRPKFNPPNSQRIIDTMESYGIPKYRNQEPFFSNEADVFKQKELAQKMLKVPGKGLKDVTSFISSVEGVTGILKWRKMKINELQPALAKSKDINAIRALVGDDVVSLTPLIKPPTQKDVANWVRARNYLEKKKQKANKTKEMRPIEIQGKIKDEECGSNYSDVSVIEASPEIIIGETDSEDMKNCTLKIKLANRRLLNKTEELIKCKLMSSDSEKVKDSVKASGLGKRTSVTQNSSSTEIDPSLLSIFEKSHLFKDHEASKHLGVSCGQIDFLSDSTRSNVANENLQNAKALTRYQYLTIMCLEVHVSTRGDLLPDAQYDSISAIFYSIQSDVPQTCNIKPLEHGVIVLADVEKAKNKMHYSYASKIPWSISFANDEEAVLNALVNLITRTDPEILIGWELETLSWGYVFQRATRLGMNLSKRISRIPATQCKWETPASDIESMAEVKLPGRIVLDIWRIMRHEAALLSYTFESVMHHVLNERVPCPSFKILTDWWNLKPVRPSRWRVIEHYSLRVLGVFRLLDQLDIIGRTSELARLFGIQFYEVFSRGSQYRVESVMLRLAKPLNYIAVSPTPLQRSSMRAMEALPLILEPESKFYSDPLIVLDFQSLYPSIIIAHNYCFSTCLGRIEHIGQAQPYEFGAYTLRVSKNTALKLEGKMNYAPCGVAYVKPEVRLGILPRMLTEILETRFMVKKAMKDHNQSDKSLQRALHSRQHGLKFLANVTYGYTAANFSGRMPCIEVGDSVISKSKETLERAIKLVEATPKWGARVVYGDTDSLFILVPGKSKAEAFVIGNEIADAVTASNLPPIKLKFEKVMYPSILQTKKRYCGYMYETPDQQTPTYLAKGIETVRRDGCPAVSKILEKTLKILFDTKDVSLVKKYVTRQLDKVLRGKVSIIDLTFAKEFRGLKGYKAKACVPALELTRRLIKKDPRAIPRNSERVRYVIVAGPPNQPLIHCVRTPWELINHPGLRPNAIYYVTRVIIPPLNRCLNLMGVDVNAWYRDMPHRQILNNPVGQPVDKQKLTIFQYFGTIVCVSCGEPSSKGICAECLTNPADTLVVLHEKLRWLHRTYDQATAICQSCVGQTDIADCSSLECPVLYRRAQAQRELSQATHLQSIIECGNALEF